MPDPLYQEIDAFFRSHLAQMKLQRKDDARRAVHAPEQRADAVLRRLVEVEIPEQHLPIHGPSFTPERRGEGAAIRPVTVRHVTLQMMAWNELVKNGGAGKMN